MSDCSTPDCPLGTQFIAGFDSLQGAKSQTMKAMFKILFFDRELVNQIKEVKVNEGVLYNQLISGKITLQEYLELV